jgi:GT2 family glycosyltransferase
MQSCVVLLNWNGWKDTIECLESVFRLGCRDFRVVVCDNTSTDGSFEKIRQWARGELAAGCANAQLSWLTSPPVPKPIQCLAMTRAQAESHTGGWEVPLTLVQTGGNLGFAAGNNVGLRLALSDPDCQYFWLLNNDTVVESDSLSAMVRLMQQRPEVGLCGSLSLSYYNPKEVQAQGGKPYCRWTARVHTPPLRMVEELDFHPTPTPMDFVNGASMLASRAFLERVGLMEESYFLYFEELDWAMRAKGKFQLGYTRESVIYHKEGASIGSNPDRGKRSLLSDKYYSRNRVLFTRRFLPWALPSVLLSVSLAAAYRAWRGDLERAKAMLTFMLQGLRLKPCKTRNS